MQEDIEYTEWNGYQRKNFRLYGRDCLMIIPEKEFPGKPWVWRAEFFGAFDYADRELLKQGWHICYIENSDRYGCSEAIDTMEAFYTCMTEEEGLNKKVDLFGFSRGGLYSVNFTARHPECISTLYLDAPVMNITSWPGGYGASERYPKEWEECKAVYGLTDETALEFHENPLDKMSVLLNAHVKIMLVAGAADSVVPFKENGAKLAEYYQNNGGQIKVIVKPDCDHHPHSLEDPTPITAYIMENFKNNK